MTLTQINKAGLDELALDHVFTIGASGTDHYTFQGEGLNGTVNDPTLYLTRGKTYRFENGTGAHPIQIQSVAGAGGSAYSTGVTNNAGSGTVIVEVQHDAPDVLYYQCTSHANMNGVLYITGALADGGVTTAKLADDAVTDAKLANSINSSIAANTAKTSNATHTGDVTGSTSLTIANNAVTTAKIADQAVTLAKLPHGDGSSNGKFLRANNGADPSFETVSIPAGTTINNNADNRVITGSGTANTLEGEANFIAETDSNGAKLLIGASADVTNTAGEASWQGLKLKGSRPYLVFHEDDRSGEAQHGFVAHTTGCLSIAKMAGRLNFSTSSSGAVSEKMTLTGDGNLGLATTSPTAWGTGIPTMEFKGTANNSRGGAIAFESQNGSSGYNVIYSDAGDLRIYTGATNRASATEKVMFPRTGGITFNGDTAAANAISDYEEGTFSPAVAAGTTVTQTFDSQGRYTKIGRQVYVQFLLQYSGAGTSAHFKFSGLPFTALNNSSRGGGTVLWTNIPGLNDFDAISAIVSGDDTAIFLYYNMDNNATTGSGGFTNKAIYVRVTYEAA